MCSEDPISPCKSPHMPDVLQMTRWICFSRFDQRRSAVHRPSFKSSYVPMNASTIACAKWVMSLGNASETITAKSLFTRRKASRRSLDRRNLKQLRSQCGGQIQGAVPARNPNALHLKAKRLPRELMVIRPPSYWVGTSQTAGWPIASTNLSAHARHVVTDYFAQAVTV